MANKIQLEMVKEFQCPGCSCGIDPETCKRFDLASESWGFHSNSGFHYCKNWLPSTFFGGIGRVALGLPKGFCRIGVLDFEKVTCYVRLHESPKDIRYNKLNVAVWAMVQDGYLFVRVFSPRINTTYVDIIKDGSLDLVPNAINIAEFYEEID